MRNHYSEICVSDLRLHSTGKEMHTVDVFAWFTECSADLVAGLLTALILTITRSCYERWQQHQKQDRNEAS